MHSLLCLCRAVLRPNVYVKEFLATPRPLDVGVRQVALPCMAMHAAVACGLAAAAGETGRVPELLVDNLIVYGGTYFISLLWLQRLVRSYALHLTAPVQQNIVLLLCAPLWIGAVVPLLGWPLGLALRAHAAGNAELGLDGQLGLHLAMRTASALLSAYGVLLAYRGLTHAGGRRPPAGATALLGAGFASIYALLCVACWGAGAWMRGPR